MKLIEIIRMIFVNLVQNKYKVLLTSLGIIIGTITITLVIAIGQGGEKKISDQFKNMSVETIYINYMPSMNDSSSKNIEQLNEKSLSIIKEENPFIDDIYMRTLFTNDVSFPKKKVNMILTAVTRGYSDVSNYMIQAGSNFEDIDFEDGKRVTVLGESTAIQYFGGVEDALNKELSIDGVRYRIIGVLNATNDSLKGVSPDQSLFIPHETAIKNKHFSNEQIPQGVALAKDKKVLKKAIARVESSLDYIFEDSQLYSVEDAGSRIDAAMESATTMKFLLVSVATIVFIVSGIGIMNVLFVSVKERTREIGVLKAIGTTQGDILLLFLLESVGIGVLGGITGVILSSVLLLFMKDSAIATHPTVFGKVIALAFAVVTATIFGFYPAYKASKLKPIEALNQE